MTGWAPQDPITLDHTGNPSVGVYVDTSNNLYLHWQPGGPWYAEQPDEGYIWESDSFDYCDPTGGYAPDGDNPPPFDVGLIVSES